MPGWMRCGGGVGTDLSLILRHVEGSLGVVGVFAGSECVCLVWIQGVGGLCVVELVINNP